MAMEKERLYRYACNSEGNHHTGITWNTCKENVINDVKSNYHNAKRIIVSWLKEGSMEYETALIYNPNMRRDV